MSKFSPSQSDYAVLYHWWSHDDEKRVVKNIKVPVLPSLATMRSKNPDVAAYVVDYSDEEYDWEDYPSRLRFSVIRRKAALESFIPKKDLWNLYGQNLYTGYGPLDTTSARIEDSIDCMDVKRCSWPLDVWEVAHSIPERYIASVECDVFWINPLLPLRGDADRFNVRENDSGVYYFDKEAEAVARWIEMWQAYVCLAVKDFSFRRRLINKFPHPVIISIDKLHLYLQKSYPETYTSLVNGIGPMEVLMPTDFVGHGYDSEFMANLRWVHLASRTMGAHKGRFPLFFQELFEDLRKFFSPEELIDIYGMAVFNNSVYSYSDLNEPMHSPFFNSLMDRMHAEIPPI